MLEDKGVHEEIMDLLQMGGEAFDEAEPFLDLPQQDLAAVGGVAKRATTSRRPRG